MKKAEELMRFSLSWREYSVSWIPFVKDKKRNWDMSYSKGEVTITCPSELYDEFMK